MLAERQDPASPYLFDENDLPMRQDLVAMVQRGVHRHTGARLLEDEKLCLRLVEMLMAKWGVKRIASELHVSPHSVRAAREALVARGEMAPWKQRVVALFDEIVEVGAASFLRDLEDGKANTKDKYVGTAVIYDKRALAVGEPTSIDLSARVVANPADLTVERLTEKLRALESVSGAPVPKLAGSVEVSDPGTSLGATCPPADPPRGGGGEGGGAVKVLTESAGGDTNTKEAA